MREIVAILGLWLILMILILSHGLAAVLITFALIAGVVIVVICIKMIMKKTKNN